MPIFQLEDAIPLIDPSVFVAPTASVIGKVTIGKASSVWFNTVIRADFNTIIIGEKTNIQDLTMCHVDPGHPLVIGNRITIGHQCIIHGCTIEDDCLIGMGAIIMSGAKIGRGSVVASGALILGNTVIPPFSLVAGFPGEIKRTFEDGIPGVTKNAVAVYAEKARKCKSSNFMKKIAD